MYRKRQDTEIEIQIKGEEKERQKNYYNKCKRSNKKDAKEKQCE